MYTTTLKMNEYETKLKYQRDLKNVIDTAFEEGKLEGILESKLEGKLEGKRTIAMAMLAGDESTEYVMRMTGLSREEIETLKKNIS